MPPPPTAAAKSPADEHDEPRPDRPDTLPVPSPHPSAVPTSSRRSSPSPHTGRTTENHDASNRSIRFGMRPITAPLLAWRPKQGESRLNNPRNRGISINEGRKTMKVSMPRWIGLGLFVFASLGISICSLRAEETGAQGNDGLSVTVVSGSGLNTLGATNHHVLPPEIKRHIYPRPDKNSTSKSLLLRDQSARWATRHGGDHQSPQWFQSARVS